MIAGILELVEGLLVEGLLVGAVDFEEFFVEVVVVFGAAGVLRFLFDMGSFVPVSTSDLRFAGIFYYLLSIFAN